MPQTMTGPRRLPRGLSAFRHRNYRLFFSGQTISLTGTWMQSVAQSWLAVELTQPENRALMLGVISAVSALPVLLLSLPAGLVADRFNKRNIIVVCQSSAMILALTLAALTYFQVINIYFLIAVGFLLGTVNSLDTPTRHSFVIDMVGREDLPNAIALNSAVFNAARIVGPAVAGLVIAAVGLAGAFFLNGLSYIAVIIGLMMMRVEPPATVRRGSAIQDLRRGIEFALHHRMISGLLLLTATVSVFATSYTVLLPMYVSDILGQNALELGYLMSAVGVGALAGAVTISALGNFQWKGRLLITGNIVFCLTLIAFSFTSDLRIALCLLPAAGWGIMTNMSMTNTLIQIATPNEMRGRITSLYTPMFLGMAPLGGIQAGGIAQLVGVPWAIRIGAMLTMTIGIALSPRFARAR